MALKKISELNAASSADVTADDTIIINDGSTTKRVSLSNLISGSDVEVRGLFSASGDLSYDSAAGEFSVTIPPGYDSSDFDTDFSGKSTDDLSEGTNLYYTDARVDSHLSGGTGVSYSSGTISIGQAVGTTDNVTFNTVTANDFNSTSDARKKTNVETITDASSKVSNLRGVSFDWAESGESSIGLIAQELEQVIPEVVSTGEDGLKSVSYGNLVGLLIEAIKDQQNQIDELKNKVYK